ncbi:type-2 ice-structuring protein-like [Micropterus dolomieu]|uniref:type-2 ice-structuring protein-like n=1 Tax=Micropterus dolomieu TaxID=147949 RepID=UPI001E8E7DEC|nr:type-2 ice-structuring protein-like [Micropterus dolomieu]
MEEYDSFRHDMLPSCPYDWSPCRTRCLHYVEENMTWAEAEQNCRSMNGTLAYVINSEDDIYGLFWNTGQQDGQIWVGGCNVSEDPSWPGQSTVADEQEHQCLQINYEGGSPGCLDETQCDARLPSVCRFIMI